MPELMNEETREKLVEVLSVLHRPVKLLLFTEADPGPASEMQQEILESVADLSDRLDLEIRNPISELLDVQVTRIEQAEQGFAVHSDDGREFAAHAVVYCAGKEYARLGVPNEERFIGRGIAFCATCDAPLYTGRRVAVVGGANSALTAVRDLLGFAEETHLIHRRDTFKADAP
jgi:thioredoxin reductase